MERYSRDTNKKQLEQSLLGSKDGTNKKRTGMWWRREDTSENRNDIAEIKKALLTSIDNACKSFNHIAIAINTVKGRNMHNFSECNGNIYKNMTNGKLGDNEAKSILNNAYSLDKFIYDSLIFGGNFAGSDITKFNKYIQDIKDKVNSLSEINDILLKDSKMINSMKQLTEKLPEPVTDPALLFSEGRAPDADDYGALPKNEHLKGLSLFERCAKSMQRVQAYESYKKIFAQDEHFNNLKSLEKLLKSI